MSTARSKRMRTAGDVVKRLMWDPALPEDGFTVGYLDRFVGVLEEDFYGDDDLVWTDVPEHRIQWFRYRGVTVWEKRIRLDLVFGTANGGGRTLPAVVRHIDEFLENGGTVDTWAPDALPPGKDAAPPAPSAGQAPVAAARPPPSEAGSTLSATAGPDDVSLAAPASGALGRARSASDPGTAASSREARQGVPPRATHAIVAPVSLPAAFRGGPSGRCAVPLAWLEAEADEAEVTAAGLLVPLARRAGALVPPAAPLASAVRPASGIDDARRGVPLKPHAGASALAEACSAAAAAAGLVASVPLRLSAVRLPASHVAVAEAAAVPFPSDFVEPPAGLSDGSWATLACLELVRIPGA